MYLLRLLIASAIALGLIAPGPAPVLGQATPPAQSAAVPAVPAVPEF